MADPRRTERDAPPDLKRMIRKLANQLASSKGLDREDAYQTGITRAMEYRDEWKPEGTATFNTCAVNQAHFAILDMAAKEQRQRNEYAGIRKAVGPLVEIIVAPDPTLEDKEREDHLVNELGFYALAGTIGYLESPSSPEELFANAQERALFNEGMQKGLAEADPIDRELFLECKLEEKPVTVAAKQRGLKQADAFYRVRRSFEAVRRHVLAVSA